MSTTQTPPGDTMPAFAHRITRRDLLLGAGGLFAAATAGKWIWDSAEHFRTSEVFVARAESYGPYLVDLLQRGLGELGLSRKTVAGKSVLLKPNLVEPTVNAPHVNTHPAFVRAVVEVFRKWDAREVFVAEGQGHCRDTSFVLEQSGLERILDDDQIAFVDLNYDDVFSADNRSRFTNLPKLYLPQSLRRADFIVSLPKMKTHHWAGVTLSMKNLFGVMPGALLRLAEKRAASRGNRPVDSRYLRHGPTAPGHRRRHRGHGGRRTDHGDSQTVAPGRDGDQPPLRRCHMYPAHGLQSRVNRLPAARIGHARANSRAAHPAARRSTRSADAGLHIARSSALQAVSRGVATT